MLKNYFALADVRLATQMWCDLQAAGADLAAYSETVWAAGIIYTFVKLNGAYTFFDERIAGFLRNGSGCHAKGFRNNMRSAANREA